MSKWEQYAIEPSKNTTPSKWEQYAIETPEKKSQEGDSWDPLGDLSSWGSLIGKSALQGLTSIPDLPANLLHAVERGGRKTLGFLREQAGKPNNIDMGSENDFFSPENVDRPSKWLNAGANKLGIDLTPRPTTAAQRIVSNAAEFAGGVGPFGLASKGAKALSAINTAGKGALIGGTSGVLQEGGVDPLAADLFSIFALPTGSRAISNTKKVAGNLLNNFTKAGQEQKIRSAAGDILKDKVGEKNIGKVLGNLNAPTPFNANLTTAERANNTGISSLHRALAPNFPAIAEKEALTENILRKELNQLSPQRGLEPSQQGESIRNYLDKELQNRISTRSNVTTPLYEEVNALRTGVDLPNFENFLREKGKFARGNIAKSFNYLENVVKGKSTSKGDPTLSIAGKEALDFKNLSPKTQEKLRNELGMGNKPIPPEIISALEDISGTIDVAKTSGNKKVAHILSEAKANLLKDMAAIPEERIAREAYAKLSKPVNAIEKQPLLKKIVKKDIYNNDFLTSPEKIPEMILRGSVNDTKALISEIGTDNKTLNIIRGSVVDKLINSSELSAVNAAGQSSLSYTKVDNFLKKNKEKLKYIFNEDQIKVLDEVKDVLKRRNMVATMGRGVGSNTQSQTTLLEGLTNPIKKSLTNKIASKIPGGRYLTPLFEMTKKYEKQQIISLLEKALLDPQIAKSLLTPVGSIKTQESLKSILTKIGIPATAYSFSRQEKEGE
jgi:hypothetical protein